MIRSYRTPARHLLMLAALAMLLPACAQAARYSVNGDFVQGGLVIGRTQPGTRVTLDGRTLRVSPDGAFVLGFGRNAKKAVLTLTYPDGASVRRTLKVRTRKYRIQRLTGLPPRKVTPPPEDLKKIRAESKLIRSARAADTPSTWFLNGFTWPARGRISGVYGSQRVLNGKPRAPHSGTDVAAPTGTPVVAAADGRVALARRDMFYTGHTIMLDHGHGVTTIYAHLSALSVKQGARVKKGQRIGRIGATGRVTGPHLHWGLSHFGTRLDPALVVGPMPEPKEQARK